MNRLFNNGQIVIALGFWDVVTVIPEYPIFKNEKMLLDYMYGRIDEFAARTYFQNSMVSYDLPQLVKEGGWVTILEAAGGDKFINHFTHTIDELCRLIPGVKVGLVVNDIIQLSEMLKETGIHDRLDFVINSSFINCNEPNPDFYKELLEIASGGRVILIDDLTDIPPNAIGNFEQIHFNKMITCTGLFETIVEYLYLG